MVVIDVKFPLLEQCEDLELGFKKFEWGHADPEGNSDGPGGFAIVCMWVEHLFDGVGALLEGKIFNG